MEKDNAAKKGVKTKAQRMAAARKKRAMANAAQKDVYSECDACGKVLKFGNTVVSLNKNIEQIDASDEYPGGEVTVVASTGLLELCADCGSHLDSEMLAGLLKTILIDSASGES